MSTTAERIPLYIPPPETDDKIDNSVLCRAVTHRGLVRLRNEDSFVLFQRNVVTYLPLQTDLAAIGEVVSLVKWQSIPSKVNLKSGTERVETGL